MILFLLSLLPLFVGPVLVGFLKNRPQLIPSLDGFVLVSVGGIIVFHVLPDAIAEGGVYSVGAAMGLALLIALDRLEHHDQIELSEDLIAPFFLTPSLDSTFPLLPVLGLAGPVFELSVNRCHYRHSQ